MGRCISLGPKCCYARRGYLECSLLNIDVGVHVQDLLPLGGKMGLGDRPCTATQNSWGCVPWIHLSPGP